MSELANRVVREGLSVRSLEEIVSGVKIKPKRPVIVPGGRTDMLSELADELADYLNTGVKINLSRKKGQIHIDFGSVADLRRIIEEIKRH